MAEAFIHAIQSVSQASCLSSHLHKRLRRPGEEEAEGEAYQLEAQRLFGHPTPIGHLAPELFDLWGGQCIDAMDALVGSVIGWIHSHPHTHTQTQTTQTHTNTNHTNTQVPQTAERKRTHWVLAVPVIHVQAGHRDEQGEREEPLRLRPPGPSPLPPPVPAPPFHGKQEVEIRDYLVEEVEGEGQPAQGCGGRELRETAEHGGGRRGGLGGGGEAAAAATPAGADLLFLFVCCVMSVCVCMCVCKWLGAAAAQAVPTYLPRQRQQRQAGQDRQHGPRQARVQVRDRPPLKQADGGGGGQGERKQEEGGAEEVGRVALDGGGQEEEGEGGGGRAGWVLAAVIAGGERPVGGVDVCGSEVFP